MASAQPVDPEPKQKEITRRDGVETTLERLRGMILSGEIPPGAVVSQLRMAKQLGVSTTPLREAMRQLQSEGLLEAELNRRPRVPELEIDDLHAVYATRILLESLAVSLTVSTIRDEEIAALSDDLAEMRDANENDHTNARDAAHDRFHRRLVLGATSAMEPVLNSYFDRTERYRHLSSLREEPRGWNAADQEHERIVEACADRNPDAAASELAIHLGRTAIALSASFAPEVDPAPVRRAIGLITRPDPRRSSPARR